MAGKKKQKPSEPGLIRIICPADGCVIIHRIPVNLNFSATLTEEGEVEIYIQPDPDISELTDHMAFEHGWY